MRICSLLPSASEIIAELGHADSLVGVSDECRWPAGIVGKPVVTAARIDASALTSREIDSAVRASLEEGGSLYAVDATLIEELRPDLIVTQDLCAVCAVSSGDLATAFPLDVEVLSLDPRTLGGVAETFHVLARRLGTPIAAGSSRTSSIRRSARSPTPCRGSAGGGSSSPSGSIRPSAPVTGSRR
jgi:iron complex transport system substrate-binding protein